MFKHILFATDGSELSDKALALALGLARPLGARVTAFNAVAPYIAPVPDIMFAYAVSGPLSPEEYEKSARAASARILASATAKLEAAGVACDTMTVVAAAPWEAIVKAAAERKCDAIVMASHGRRGIAGLLIGSETQKVLIHATIPVVVCR